MQVDGFGEPLSPLALSQIRNSIVKLPGETMCAMKFDAVAVVGNVSVDTDGRLEFHRIDVKGLAWSSVVLAASDTYCWKRGPSYSEKRLFLFRFIVE